VSGRIHVDAVGIDAEHAPAIFFGTTRQHRSPIHHLLVDGETDLAHVLRQHLAGSCRDRAGDLQDNDRFALVARLRQRRLGARDIELRDLGTRVGGERRAA